MKKFFIAFGLVAFSFASFAAATKVTFKIENRQKDVIGIGLQHHTGDLMFGLYIVDKSSGKRLPRPEFQYDSRYVSAETTYPVFQSTRTSYSNSTEIISMKLEPGPYGVAIRTFDSYNQSCDFYVNQSGVVEQAWSSFAICKRIKISRR